MISLSEAFLSTYYILDIVLMLKSKLLSLPFMTSAGCPSFHPHLSPGPTAPCTFCFSCTDSRLSSKRAHQHVRPLGVLFPLRSRTLSLHPALPTHSSCESQVRSHISGKPPEGLFALGTNCSSVIPQVVTWRTEASCVCVSSPTVNSEDRALD